MIRKKNGKGLLLLLITGVLLMTGSTGCSKQAADTKQKVEGLDKLGQIKVISREEGSGTRGTFAQLAGFVQENTDKDQTVKDAKIAEWQKLYD
jgi:phosphate transport system substrate-binding protein